MPRLSSHLAALALVAATLARSTPVAASFPFLRLGQDSGFLYHSFAEALANSFSASGITVYPGTYHECVNVTGFVLFTIVFKKGAILDATGCGAGITISDGEGMTVKGAVIVGAKQGIVVKAAPTRVLISKSTIEDGAADPVLATMETGITIDGTTDVTIAGVTIHGATMQAVHAVSATDITIEKSTFANGIGDGVVVDLGDNVTIEKNVVTNLGGPGVRFFHNGIGAMGGAVDSTILSNTIFANPIGIAVGGTNNVVEKNKLTDLTVAGIQALNGSGGSFYRKNTIVRAATAAIYVGGSLDTFEKNTVKDPPATGIDVAGSDNVFLAGKVSGAGGTAIAIRPGASGNHFEGTAATKSVGDGFHVQGVSNVFVKAKASGSGGLDLDDPAGASTTNSYADCKFKTANAP